MAIRSTWSGVLGWGMVTIPVKMGRATTDDSVTMHQVHTEDGGRVRYKKVCETCAAELTPAEIGKGAELATGETVTLTDDDLAGLPLPTLKRADIVHFCDESEIDPVSRYAAYYLWPGQGGSRAYRLLQEALEDSGKVAVCKIAIRSRESVAVVSSRDGVLMLTTLYWPAEVREPDFSADLAAEPEPPAEERKMAAQLVEMATRAFNAAEHKDEYSAAVRALIDGREGTTPPAVPSGSDAVTSLLETLQAAVDEAKAARKPARKSGKAKAGAAA